MRPADGKRRLPSAAGNHSRQPATSSSRARTFISQRSLDVCCRVPSSRACTSRCRPRRGGKRTPSRTSNRRASRTTRMSTSSKAVCRPAVGELERQSVTMSRARVMRTRPVGSSSGTRRTGGPLATGWPTARSPASVHSTPSVAPSSVMRAAGRQVSSIRNQSTPTRPARACSISLPCSPSTWTSLKASSGPNQPRLAVRSEKRRCHPVTPSTRATRFPASVGDRSIHTFRPPTASNVRSTSKPSARPSRRNQRRRCDGHAMCRYSSTTSNWSCV